MRTLLPDPPPLGVAALLEQHRRTGVDRFDQVWDGARHVNPASSTGSVFAGATTG